MQAILRIANEDIGDNRKIQRAFAVTAGCFWLLFCGRVLQRSEDFRGTLLSAGCFFAAFNSEISQPRTGRFKFPNRGSLTFREPRATNRRSWWI
jgi:hypothetical protein